MKSHLDNLKSTMATQDALHNSIARSVDLTIRENFPNNFHSLCHVYAVVGANIASIVLGHEYRPVAGMAVIDCGGGNFLRFTDDNSLLKECNGAYHCWIESSQHDGCAKEIIDISFTHKHIFAKKCNIKWRKKSPRYLWGKAADILLDSKLNKLPSRFPEGKLWLCETNNGIEWMNRQVATFVGGYVNLTTLALNRLIQESAYLSEAIAA